MKNNHTLAILMATYNGERFLREQLDSLLAQSSQDWELFVHDDCSRDDTVGIIREYETRLPERIHLLPDDITHGRGAKESFMWLLEAVESEFYAFCDQDDRWLPEKVALTLGRLQEEVSRTPGVPVLVYTDLTIADEQCRPIASYWKSSKMDDAWFDSYDSYIVQFGKCMGCTSMFNRESRNAALPMHPKVWGHDYWLALMTCVRGGRCVAIPEATILYRQHGDNTSGGAPDFSNRWWFLSKWDRISAIIGQYRRQHAFIHEVAGVGWLRFLKAKLHVIVYKIKK